MSTWLWFEAGFDDRAIEAWVERPGCVWYVDGGITFEDGSLSKRFVKFAHDVTFDGDRRRPPAEVYTDEDGREYRGARSHRISTSPRTTAPDCPAAVRRRLPVLRVERERRRRAHGDRVEDGVADQLMRFEMDGMTGMGIFELLVGGDRYPRHPAWGVPEPRRRR